MRAIPFHQIKAFAVYGALIAASVGIFMLVRNHGGHLSAPPPPDGISHFSATHQAASAKSLHHVLIALSVIIVAARAVGALFKYMNQPAVIGEVVAGIMLGPSLLGRFAPELQTAIMPANIVPLIGILAQIGVILYMFLVGLELDTGLLKGKSHSSIAISHASIVAPFVLGSTLALFIYEKYSTSDVPFTPFALFMGVSMSITAFPVLARILTDRGISKTRLGTIALACAAVDDVTAWCLLAFVVGIVRSQAETIVATLALTALYILFVLFVVRKGVLWLVRYRDRQNTLSNGLLGIICVAMLVSALVTEMIGIHALFGAFLLGAIIPHDSKLAHDITLRLEQTVIVLFLPTFFAFTGLRTQIGLVETGQDWMFVGAIILVASLGKLGGTYVAARMTGHDRNESASLGILMNTRGLMELIVLNVGLDLGVLSKTLFAMMVIMALVTTFATTPVLHFLERRRSERTDLAAQGA